MCQLILNCVTYRALSYYSDCGLACPEHRAPADHFIFRLNTDFKTQAADFIASSTAHQIAHAMENGSMSGDDIESVDRDSALQTLTAAFERQIRVRIGTSDVCFSRLCQAVLIFFLSHFTQK